MSENLQLLEELTERLLKSQLEREKSLAAVRASENLWRQTVDALPDYIFVTDTKLTIQRANKAFSDLVGVPLDELPGKRCFDVFSCRSTDYASLGACTTQRIVENNYQPMIKTTYLPQFKKWFEVRVFFANHDINGFIHVLRDITSQRSEKGESADASV